MRDKSWCDIRVWNFRRSETEDDRLDDQHLSCSLIGRSPGEELRHFPHRPEER